MSRTLRFLLLSAVGLSGGGGFSYHLGSRMNLLAESGDPTLWEQAPGDLWLYVGGLMMLIAGSLIIAGFLVWKSEKRSGRSVQGSDRLIRSR